MFFGNQCRVGWMYERGFFQVRLWGLWITKTWNEPAHGVTVSNEGWTVWFYQRRLA